MAKVEVLVDVDLVGQRMDLVFIVHVADYGEGIESVDLVLL